MNYYIIGERELVLAFGLVGVKGEVAVNRNEALDAFLRVTSGGVVDGKNITAQASDIRILILTESVSVLIEDEVLAWQKKGDFPLIVEIPPIQGHLQGKKRLTDAIREAIGVHI
ncbi:MAG: V-type ATP synthase subunit F [Treponemataceae bacterium]